MMAIAVSLFFGLVAIAALVSCFASLQSGIRQARAIRAELVAARPVRVKASVRLRRPQDALLRAYAA